MKASVCTACDDHLEDSTERLGRSEQWMISGNRRRKGEAKWFCNGLTHLRLFIGHSPVHLLCCNDGDGSSSGGGSCLGSQLTGGGTNCVGVKIGAAGRAYFEDVGAGRVFGQASW